MASRANAFRIRAALAAVLATAAALSGGCAPTSPPPRSRQVKAVPVRVEKNTAPLPRPSGAPSPVATDPCPARLHDLSGLLLQYYIINHHLPERLEDLAPLADADTEFKTTCPASGQPYVYVPSGLPAQGTGRVLLVYDAVPAHNGIRWVIVATAPQGDQPLSTWVMPFTEARFRQHVPQRPK